MSATYKSISPEHWGRALKRDISTSGTLHRLVPSKNSLLPIPPSNAQTLIVSLENFSSLMAEIRFQSKSLYIRGKEPIGPNAFHDLYLPYSDDWEFSVDKEFKVSEVQTLAITDEDTEYSIVPKALPSFKITSSNPMAQTEDGWWETNGLINITKAQRYSDQDFILLQSTGSGYVIKFNHLRFMAEGSFWYLLPANLFPEVVPMGSEDSMSVNLVSYMRTKHDPKYVAPDALLWELENTHADR